MSRQRQVFVYDSEEHADIARWLEAQDNKSASIRRAIRDVIQVRALAETVRSVVREELSGMRWERAQATTGRSQDVDPEAGRLLDEMF